MRILHFCFILSFILSPILEYNNQEILIENFEIIENDEYFDICFTNKTSVGFSMFKVNINKNFHESFKVDLGNNKISINKDYFIDMKIPKNLRDSQLLIADDSHVLWVVGYRISEDVKITDETACVLEIEVNRV